MADPYKALGVRKNASPEALKRAYRKRAMQTHPDRGGDPDAFGAVNRAWLVLSDPARRRRYDETGDDSLPAPDNVHAAVAGVLAQAFAAVINGLLSQGRGVADRDLVGLMRSHLEDARRQAREALGRLKAAREVIADARGRLSEEGDPFVVPLVQEQLDGLARQEAAVRGQEELAGKALERLARCKFRFEPPKYPSATAATSTSTTGVWRIA